MGWIMPAETARHERSYLAFPAEGPTLGNTDAEKEECYRTWSDVALAVAEHEPMTVIVDPAEHQRAKNLMGGDVSYIVAPVDEFWIRDHGPTFVVKNGKLGAVTWKFNGWGDHGWSSWKKSKKHGKIIAEVSGAKRVKSDLVNEGGGIHVDGEGTVLVTETVQLDPRRNPDITREEVEKEFKKRLGARNTVWVPRGLTADYEEFGTNGHIDIVATFAEPGKILVHAQTNPNHPDYKIAPLIREALANATDHQGQAFELIDIPGPETVRSGGDLVDWSYINHYVVNDGVIACSFGDDYADARAKELLEHAYGRPVTAVDARPIFYRGGGVHCITQQQPEVPRE